MVFSATFNNFSAIYMSNICITIYLTYYIKKRDERRTKRDERPPPNLISISCSHDGNKNAHLIESQTI